MLQTSVSAYVCVFNASYCASILTPANRASLGEPPQTLSELVAVVHYSCGLYCWINCELRHQHLFVLSVLNCILLLSECIMDTYTCALVICELHVDLSIKRVYGSSTHILTLKVTQLQWRVLPMYGWTNFM